MTTVDTSSLLLELYGRVVPLAREAVDGLDADALAAQPAPGVNSIGWLVWHLARVQDHHTAELLETEQVWVEADWPDRFGLDPDPGNTGYGHSAEQMSAVRPEGPEALLEYLEAVAARTQAMLSGVTGDDLDRIVDRRWDPPVTLGVRLVSVADDCLQHVGQATYARGLLGV